MKKKPITSDQFMAATLKADAAALRKEKHQAMKEMIKVYETSRDPQNTVEELFRLKYSHLGRYQQCNGCDDEEPHIDNICCVCGSKNKPMVLSVEITGLTHDDLKLGLTEVITQISNGFLEGSNSNDTGRFHFKVKS